MPSESVPQALVPSFAAMIKEGYFFLVEKSEKVLRSRKTRELACRYCPGKYEKRTKPSIA